MYLITLGSSDLLTLNAPYPCCQANPLLFGKVSCTHREEFESFLVLGFGSSGHDMLKAFEVQYIGDEKIDGVETAKLDLTPKSEKVKQNFAHILLWIDPQRGLSVQQQLFEPNGDNRLAKYFDIQVNQKISDNVFKLKTSAKTKILTH